MSFSPPGLLTVCLTSLTTRNSDSLVPEDLRVVTGNVHYDPRSQEIVVSDVKGPGPNIVTHDDLFLCLVQY